MSQQSFKHFIFTTIWFCDRDQWHCKVQHLYVHSLKLGIYGVIGREKVATGSAEISLEQKCWTATMDKLMHSGKTVAKGH